MDRFNDSQEYNINYDEYLEYYYSGYRTTNCPSCQ